MESVVLVTEAAAMIGIGNEPELPCPFWAKEASSSFVLDALEVEVGRAGTTLEGVFSIWTVMGV